MDNEVVMTRDSDTIGTTLSKREKFVQLAEKRTVNAIKAIRVIGKLANRSAYEYTDADGKKIAKILNDEIDALKSRMASTGGKDTIEFRL